MGERRGLNPRVVDSQSTALIHLATSAPTPELGERKLQQVEASWQGFKSNKEVGLFTSLI
nr:74 [Ipomoea batatas]